MNYKPDEKDWMAYLYGELQADDKEKFEQYLLENKDARKELEKFTTLRQTLSSLDDKEVIAPPIVIGDGRQRFIWNIPYFRTIISIAASLLLLLVAGRITGTKVTLNNNEFRLSFGESREASNATADPGLSAQQVQQMINSSLQNNNSTIEASWKENEERLTASIRKNLAANSVRIDQLVRQASTASQEQVRDYVASIQAENMRQVKDYFQLTSTEQKNYIENLLVDFAGYLQQQRENDLQVVQTRLNSIEQNTDIFKQETEQILSSIITTVGGTENNENRN